MQGAGASHGLDRRLIAEHLSHLPVTAQGYPVPFVASWTSEHWSTSKYDARLKHHALFTAGERGEGKPVLGLLNEPRQRLCVFDGRCQICGQRIAEGYLPEQIVNGDERLDDGTPVTSEPLCCKPCAEFSMRTCPHLTDGRILIVHEYELLNSSPIGDTSRLTGSPGRLRQRTLWTSSSASCRSPTTWTHAAPT